MPPKSRVWHRVTSSEQWGSGNQVGKYPTKIYTIDGVLIYQEDRGGDNTGKTPLGGVIAPNTLASSMLATIANPITFYGGSVVINQSGHSGDLYNYYWTSYSRGTDGKSTWPYGYPLWHNVYLDGYIPLRVKSIYDPCPYLYRIPSNGTYNQFTYPRWTRGSYLGGVSWNLNTLGESWFTGLGWRNAGSSSYIYVSGHGNYITSTVNDKFSMYSLLFGLDVGLIVNYSSYVRSQGQSVRCIEASHEWLRKRRLMIRLTGGRAW